MHQSTYIENILSYFSSMDIGNLRQHLKEYSYEATTKEVFLDELERIFESYKNSGDTHLLLYEGKCVEGTCPNCGKNGYRFVGDSSKNYMDLLFEIEDDDIKDIYECPQFETDALIENLGIKAEIGAGLYYRNSSDETQVCSTSF